MTLCFQYQGTALSVERAIDDVEDGVTRSHGEEGGYAASGHGFGTPLERSSTSRHRKRKMTCNQNESAQKHSALAILPITV